ncbi:aminotransferase class V-fold PLP-dependent enzyme, partial [Candidatus Bathyarchaeota archaeon]|nr:aminotransferase class V-fold PLP-dependent enzyme [Candidatus Bathyarchaeota archaeon]
MRRIYMDHAAGMPLDPRVFEAMKPYFLENYGNPSSSHSLGTSARNALMESREKVARLIGAEKPEEVIFTSGGTESNNLAIKGVAYRNKEKGNHIIT